MDVKEIGARKEERERVFTEKVYAFSSTYPTEMLDEFISYWTESSEKGKLLRYEKETVFDIKRRLATWEKRNRTRYTPAVQQAQPMGVARSLHQESQKARELIQRFYGNDNN